MLNTIITTLENSRILGFLFNKRKEAATAVSQELVNLKMALESMRDAYSYEMDLGNNRQMKIDQLYEDNRTKDQTILRLTTRIAKKDLLIERLRFVKCEVRKCPGRIPPNSEY